MTCVGFDVLHHPGTRAFTWPDFTYEYDRMGNISKMITSSTAGIDTQSFDYDHLNRLWKAVASGGVANYTHNTANTDFEYDRLGNITYFGSLTQYDYTTRHSSCGSQPAHAQPHAVKQIDSNYYCYDANGNMTRRVESGVTYQQNFNVENELSSVVVNGQTTSFTYDAAGIRVKTVKPNGVVIDHPFPSYEVENPTATTPIRRSAYSIAGQTIATRVSGDPVSGNNGISYFYNDHLGSNTALRKPDGSRISTYYLPFGNYRGAAPNQTITDRDFTGQPQNRAVGLLYYQARFYVPGIGRFASADTIVPDPANPQQFNRYSYALNNAVRYTDPSGHCVFGLPCPEPVKNAIIGVAEFGLGVMAQVAHDNALSPQVRDSLTATPGESAAMIAGRVVGGYVTLTQSVAEMFGGGGMVGGGAGVCGTGVLCPAGAGAIAIGGTMATHGAVVAGNSLNGLAENISTITSSSGSGNSNSRDFRRLSNKEIEILTEAGYHPHGEKPSKGGSRLDIFKDGNGDLYLMPKDGSGPGEPLEININDLWD